MIKRFLLAIVAALMLPMAAQATPVNYIFSGLASGQLGGQSFQRTEFTITGHADTANVGPWCCSNAQNSHSSADVTLAGLGNFSFTAPTHTWIAENCCMGFGANLSLNYLNISSTPGLTNVGYSLATNIGPIAAINASTQGQFVNIGTSGGALTFSDVFQMSFEARTGDSTVPEPESFALVALGLVAAGLAGRRRVRRAD